MVVWELWAKGLGVQRGARDAGLGGAVRVVGLRLFGGSLWCSSRGSQVLGLTVTPGVGVGCRRQAAANSL